jgi:DNA-binding response OmpR family regulator
MEWAMLFSRATVWIVDDDPMFLKLFEFRMSKEGCVVSSFVRSADAFLRFNNAKPDMLVLDRNMCDVDGIDLGREFREMGYEGTIVLLSGSLDYSAKTAAVAARINLLMLKPPDFHLLSGLAKESAEKHRKPLLGFIKI